MEIFIVTTIISIVGVVVSISNAIATIVLTGLAANERREADKGRALRQETVRLLNHCEWANKYGKRSKKRLSELKMAVDFDRAFNGLSDAVLEKRLDKLGLYEEKYGN